MKIRDILTTQGMARSGAEADRLCKQGSVRVLKAECQGGFPIDPEQWRKVLDPREEIESGLPIIVGTGHWRLVSRNGQQGYDQLRGVGRAN